MILPNVTFFLSVYFYNFYNLHFTISSIYNLKFLWSTFLYLRLPRSAVVLFLPFNWFSSFEALVALQSNTVFTSSCYCVKTFSYTVEHGDHKPLLRCWNVGELMTPAVVTTLHVGALQSTETSLLWRSFSETLKSRYSSFKTLLIFSIQVLSISTFL